MSINYEYKSYCTDYLELFKVFRRAFYNTFKTSSLSNKEKERLLSSWYCSDKFYLNHFNNLIRKFPTFNSFEGRDIYHECVLLYNSLKQRKIRLKKRINLIVSKPSLFVTLTFNDSSLSSTTFEERRKAVSRYLKSQSNLYVANIDFGSVNGREHYHAVVQSTDLDLSIWRNEFGNINIKHIFTSEESLERLSRYVNKLSFHALKNSAKRYSLIYSR